MMSPYSPESKRTRDREREREKDLNRKSVEEDKVVSSCPTIAKEFYYSLDGIMVRRRARKYYLDSVKGVLSGH